ncbi:hypothetical protein [Cellulomonas sp. NS3]|uniref:hypothetical protein n=1 Tax=Cellulomonas sp. NS3 TaxID=2973977 RepID=UPI002163D9F8|nr:hypothetical protein [Cellulomonas sp. NS3]
MHPTSTAGLALALTLTLGPTPTPTPTDGPTPQPPVCGATLTTDTTLTADLVCAEGDGLRLEGPITLDLGGHTLRGPGTGRGVLTDNRTNGVVTNGTITGWASGVAQANDDFPDGQPVPTTISGVLFRGNGSGVTGFFAAFDVTRSRFVDNGTGIDIALFSDATVDRSTFRRNDVALTVGSDNIARVAASSFVDNGVALLTIDGSVEATSSRFVDNTTTASHYRGGMVLADNLVRGSEVGVEGGSFGHVLLTSNTFRDNTLAVDGDDPMTLRRNRFVENETAVLAVDPLEMGVTVDLDGDTFLRNGDAVYATGPSRIANVTAVRSSGWGIYAPNGVDGGGNVARGNGNEPQCVGVVCAPR